MSQVQSLSHGYRWDIFCTVIDNFGDIGICWRLAQQLVVEHQQAVCLWVDDLQSFQRICHEIIPHLSVQLCRGIQVRLWANPFPILSVNDIPDVVIEAFACNIPESYISLMAQKAQRKTQPIWLNIEYLSAEEWVVGCHGLQSPHPQYPLQKTFFFPGFVPGTGGVLYERNLLERRNSFQLNTELKNTFWHDMNIPVPIFNELRISLFGYPNQPDALLLLWSQSVTPVSVCAAEGALAQQCVDYLLSQGAIQKNESYCLGALTLFVMPFIEQYRYDELLWACDINFVRGEDSFVRAQWAGKPFIWQIYPQEENVHLLKLAAFIHLYQQQLDESAAKALKAFWLAWNTGECLAQNWPDFVAEQHRFQSHAERWYINSRKIGDFTTNMVIYCQKYL